MKLLLKSLREYKKTTILTPLFMIGEVICECIIPAVTAGLISDMNNGGENILREILTDGGILIVLALLSMTFAALAGMTSATASSGFAKNLRHDMFYKIQNFSFSNIDKFSTASLVTRLTTDINNVQFAFMMIIRFGARAPIMLIFATIMSAVVGKKVSLVFVFIAPVLVLGFVILAKQAMPLFKIVFKRYDVLNKSVQENIRNMRVVKSFVREDHEKKKFGEASSNIKKDFTRVQRMGALASPFMQCGVYFSVVAICFLVSKLVISTGGTYLDVGTLASMLTYSMQVLMSLLQVSMLFIMFTMSYAAIKRVTEVLEEEPDIKEKENPVTKVPNGSVDFRNVSFKYSNKAEKFALSGINLHIDSGETVGILGSTGSSKTSLIQLISRLYDASEGEVLVGGVNVKDYSLTTLRDNVSVVLQKNELFSGTIKENLRWGNAKATDDEIKNACRYAQADGFIESFPDKYDTMIEQGGTNVSGGQKQRICIARALLKEPAILILDDSTSAVDTKTDALIRKGFREVIPGTTKIIITQRVSSVCDADKIIIMDNGTINGIGTHSELLKNNQIYKEAYQIQNRVGDGNE